MRPRTVAKAAMTMGAVARSARAASARPRSGSDALSGLPLIEVEVSAGNEVQWLREVTTRWPVRAKIQVCRPMVRTPSRLLQVVELVGSPGDLEAVERYLLGPSKVKEVTVVPLAPSRRVVRVVSALPPACGMVLKTGAVCTSCRYLPSAEGGRRDRWNLLLPRSPRVGRLVASLRDASGGETPTVYRARKYRPTRALTTRQSAAIETAYRLGFYAFPRRTNLHEISRILGISRSATAELLRRAEAKMLDPALSTL